MNTKGTPPGFHQVSRHDGIFQEYRHDAYKTKGKLLEPTVCPQCNAVFHEGRWQWRELPAEPHQKTCPACHRINDHFPAGFITLEGAFLLTHRDEIMQLVHHVEERERAEHPLKRIMAIEKEEGRNTDNNYRRPSRPRYWRCHTPCLPGQSGLSLQSGRISVARELVALEADMRYD